MLQKESRIMSLDLILTDDVHIPKMPRPRLLHVYPLNTRPIYDLKVVFIFLPILWLFGLEQIVPPILIIWATFKLLLTKTRVRIPIVVFIFIILLIWQIVPQITLEHSRDWIVYGRGVVAFISAIFIILIIANDVNDHKELSGLINVVLIFSIITTGIAILFILQLIPDQFQAFLISNLLPNFLKTSRFVQESIILREIGRSDAVFGPFVYPRISSLFLSPNNASIAYVCFLSWQWYFISVTRKARRWLMVLIFMLSLIVFIFTTSRIAWIAFITSFILMNLLLNQMRFRLPLVTLLILLIVIVAGTVLFFSMMDSRPELIESFFRDVREGSFRARIILYERTVSIWAERPLTGWGVSREIADVTLAPVGTHNEFLGILFRFGLVGLVIYLFIILSIWMQIGLRIKQSVRSVNYKNMRMSILVAAIFFSVSLMHMAYSLYFDFSVVLLVWTSIGVIYAKPLISCKSVDNTKGV
jgi:O-antigen ligase